ncbi:MAG: hypothetical protein HQ521_05650 [Bacteroidetes bacterium]|nr:hypothetical protein [Bacteroidota bacterium]
MKKIKLLFFVLLATSHVVFSQTTFSWRNDQNPANNASWENTSPYYFWNGTGGAIPGGAEILFFDGTAGTLMTNNLSALNRYGISFGSTSATSRTLNGSSTNVFYDYSNNIPYIYNGAGVTHTINFPFNIGNTSTSTSPSYGMEINASSGNINIGSAISADNSTGTKVLVLRASSSGTGIITLSGIISDGSGTISISKIENNTAILVANNTYTGTTTVTAGTLQLQGSIASSNVTVQASGKLVINGDVTINNLTVVFGGTIEVLSGSNFTVAGSVHEVLGSTIIRSTGAMTINGADSETWSLFTIENDAELTINGSAAVFGSSFVIESNSSGTGSLIANGTTSGSISVERYITAWSDATHGWHLLSSPVASQAIQTEFVPDPPTSNEDFYSWDETALTLPWINSESSSGVWNTSFGTSNFVDGAGYLVAYSTNQTKTFSGTPNYSDVSKSGLTYTSGNSNTGWHLLGNPFPSALYWNKTAWGLSNIDATAKIWVESSASYTDIVAATGIIPAMQGFMVHVNASTGSLTIDAADRTHNTQAWYKDTEINKIKLIAYDTEGNTAQESIIKVDGNATTGFDNEFDSKFLPGYAPQFYSVIADGNLSTNVIPEITSALTIPLSFVKNSSNTYYIEAEGINSLEQQEMVYLTDNKINHTQILNDNPRYNFTSEEGDVSERFIIHFSPLSVQELNLDELVKVFATNSNIEIRTQRPIDAEIIAYSISGQIIGKGRLVNSSVASINISDFNGPAIVSIVTAKQSINKKVIVW